VWPVAALAAAAAAVALAPGCKCDEHSVHHVGVRLVFPLSDIPDLSEDPASDGDDEQCAANTLGSGAADRTTAIDVVDPFGAEVAALNEPRPPNLAAAGGSCLILEVMDETSASPDPIGVCRLVNNDAPSGDDGSLLRGDDRSLSITAGIPVSLRAKVYNSAGRLTYAGRTTSFTVPQFESGGGGDVSVTMPMSLEGHPYCHPFRCENGTANPCSTTGNGANGPFVLDDATTLHEPRAFHAALALGDGRVLISGGVRRIGRYTSGGTGGTLVETSELSDTAEIYDAHTGLFHLLPERMSSVRAGHSMVMLDATTVLVYGGFSTGLAYGANTERDRPMRLNVIGPADAGTPPAELLDLTTGTFTPLDTTDHLMRTMHAAGDLNGDDPGGLLALGGVSARTGDCGAPPADGVVGPNVYCASAGIPDAAGENPVAAVPNVRAAAAFTVVDAGNPGDPGFLALIGGNVAAVGALAEFRDSNGSIHAPDPIDTTLADTLAASFGPIADVPDFTNTQTLVGATLSTISATGSGGSRLLLYGGDVFDRDDGLGGGGTLGRAGICTFVACAGNPAACPQTCSGIGCPNWGPADFMLQMALGAECNANLPWGLCTESATVPGTTRPRGVAMVVEYGNLIGMPILSDALDLSNTTFTASEPSPQQILPPGTVYHAAASLPDGEVLLSGGVGSLIIDPSRTLLLYDDNGLYEDGVTPGNPAFMLPDDWGCASHWNQFDCRDPDPIRCMFTPRLGHSATVVRGKPGDPFDGMVLIAGGVSKRDPIAMDVSLPPWLATPWVEFYDARTDGEVARDVAGNVINPCTVPLDEPPNNACRVATVPAS
jgi:hypothetical protein